MKSRRLALSLFLGSLVIVLLSAGVAYAQQAQTVNMRLVEFALEPSTVTVATGQPVRFNLTNAGQFPHDLHIEGQGVVFEALPGDANIAGGQSGTATFTFTRPGTYEMWCPVGQHRERGMVGTFIVGAAPGQAGGPALAVIVGGLVAAGAGLLGGGLALRRRK